MNKKEKELKQTVDAMHQFIKAVYNQPSQKCFKLAEKIPFPYTKAANDAARTIKEFEERIKQDNSLQRELNKTRNSLDQADTQLINLRKANESKIFKNIKSKNSCQLGEVVELLKRKKYYQASQSTTKDTSLIVSDLWEYSILKSQSNKLRNLKNQEIQTIKNGSPPYFHLMNLLKNEKDDKLSMQKQFGQALYNILDLFEDQHRNQQYYLLNSQNKQLIESIESNYFSFKKQYRKLKQENMELYNTLQGSGSKEIKQQKYTEKEQQSLFYQLQQESYMQKRSKGQNKSEKSLQKEKNSKKQSKIKNTNNSLPKSLTSKIIEIAAALKIKISNRNKSQTEMQILEHIHEVIENLVGANMSLEDGNNQFSNQSKQIQRKLQDINFNLITMPNIQNGNDFERNSVNVEKCDTINQNIDLIRKYIIEISNKIDNLQKMNYKQQEIQYQNQSKIIPKSSLKQKDIVPYFVQNVATIYEGQDELLPLTNKITSIDSEVQDLKRENEDLKKRCGSLEYLIEESKKDIENSNKWIMELTEQINKFESQIKQKNNLIQQLRNDAQQQKERANESNKKVNKHRKKITYLESQINQINRNVYKPQEPFQLKESNYQDPPFVNQQRSIFINQSVFLKRQESQREIERLENELLQSKKDIQNVKKQMMQKQTQNEIKSNKLKTDYDSLKKRLIGVQKVQVQNDLRYKQLFKDHTQLLIQMNSFLVRNTELQKQLQEQKILNRAYEKQKNREQYIVNKVEHRQAMFADDGTNTSFIDQHNEVKKTIQKSETLCKIQEKYRKTKQDLQQKIIVLQSQKYEDKNKIQELISKNKQCSDIKDIKIKQLTENLQQIQQTLAQKQQQIEQLLSQIARNKQQIYQIHSQITKKKQQIDKFHELIQHLEETQQSNLEAYQNLISQMKAKYNHLSQYLENIVFSIRITTEVFTSLLDNQKTNQNANLRSMFRISRFEDGGKFLRTIQKEMKIMIKQVQSETIKGQIQEWIKNLADIKQRCQDFEKLYNQKQIEFKVWRESTSDVLNKMKNILDSSKVNKSYSTILQELDNSMGQRTFQ